MPTEYGALHDTLGFHLRLADVAMTQAVQQAFAGTGVSPARYAALELVDCNPGIRPAELGDAMAVRSSNMARMLRELQQAGWIDHDRAEDRREKRLRLTPEGAAMLEILRDRLRMHEARLDTVLTPRERQRLSQLIGKLIAGLSSAA